ncbi:helix-turn-helix domain-containing protein [Isoptericola variabilis]|uniref:helix-turn-helix domain-containing protein n=1 Tax=Isoptericola variabilis TaxID=139208 RepID=UPI003D1EEA83
MDTADVLPEVLEELRRKANITQETLAEATGIPKATLQRRLGPYDQIRFKELARIAQFFGKKPSEISAIAEARSTDFGPVQQ